MKNTDYARMLSKGKSFEYSTWSPFTKYTNDCFKQDFVSYNNVLLACKETHISETAPEFEYDEENRPIGIKSKEWHFVFSAAPLSAGGKVEIDDNLSEESSNPVQNKVLTEAFSKLTETLKDMDDEIDDRLDELKNGFTWTDVE